LKFEKRFFGSWLETSDGLPPVTAGVSWLNCNNVSQLVSAALDGNKSVLHSITLHYITRLNWRLQLHSFRQFVSVRHYPRNKRKFVGVGATRYRLFVKECMDADRMLISVLMDVLMVTLNGSWTASIVTHHGRRRRGGTQLLGCGGTQYKCPPPSF